VKRIAAPNYTQVPNVVLDSLHERTESETKIILAICRQTFGFHRGKTKLSRSTLCRFTGLTDNSVKSGIDGLLKIHWIERHQNGRSFDYSINLEEIEPPTDPAKFEGSTPQNLRVQNDADPAKFEGSTPQNLRVQSAPIPAKFDPLKRKDLKKEKERSSRAVRDTTPNPEVKVFIDEWCETYEAQFGNRYVVQGGKDGASVKRLLGSSGLAAMELIQVATRAWSVPNDAKRFYWCNRAITIATFAARWNEIVRELDKGVDRSGKLNQNFLNGSKVPQQDSWVGAW
jgi:hypothetical protein